MMTAKYRHVMMLAVFVMTEVALSGGVRRGCLVEGEYARLSFLRSPADTILRRLPRDVYTGNVSLTSCAAGVPFQYRYVGLGGVVYTTKGVDTSAPPLVEISAAPNVSDLALTIGTTIISSMAKYMPADLFITLATNGGRVGIFTAKEGLTIFPEYCQLRDTPACKGTCANQCNYLCTFDNRKYDELPGLGGQRAVVVDDNILCDSRDPYGKQLNVLVHEFAHTIYSYALTKYHPANWGKTLNSAYEAALANATWNVQSYAMSDVQEYWAESTGVFFNAHIFDSTGGMNKCGKTGNGRCSSEADARAFLALRDPLLYSVLAFAYTGGNGNLSSGLQTCMPHPDGPTTVATTSTKSGKSTTRTTPRTTTTHSTKSSSTTKSTSVIHSTVMPPFSRTSPSSRSSMATTKGHSRTPIPFISTASPCEHSVFAFCAASKITAIQHQIFLALLLFAILRY